MRQTENNELDITDGISKIQFYISDFSNLNFAFSEISDF